jgi:hypothetical protein
MQNPPKTDAMGQARVTGGTSARRWQDVVELAQINVAEALARAIGLGRFDRVRYQNWLAMESVLCRIGALSLDAVASWHGSHRVLQATVCDWAARLRVDAQAASHDIRVLDGMAYASPNALAAWYSFACTAASSQRAGEALGAVLLHEHLFQGPMMAVVGTLTTMQFGVGGQYLKRRLGAAEVGEDVLAWSAVLDAYASASLAVGAQRAANWYTAALAQALGEADIQS